MSRSGLVVEFLGLPGSGKTTLATETARLLRLSGVKAHETYADWNTGRAARLADVAGSLVPAARWKPRLLLDAWRIAGPLSGGAVGDRAKTAVHWLSRCGHYERARRVGGIHLVDQGVLQAYWSLCFAGHAEHLEALLPALESSRAHAGVVVIVSAAPQTVVERLARRPGVTSRLERSLDDPVTAMRRAEAALARVVAALREWRPHAVVIEADNDDEGGSSAAATGLCTRLLESGGATTMM